MTKEPRIERSLKELIEKLILNLELLIEFSDKAFYEYQHEKYLGEVAGKLRVLVAKFGSNKPLLLKLMHEYQYERKFPFFHGQMCTLRTYMSFLVCMSTAGKNKYRYTNEMMIRYIAEQIGASHEDWKIDHKLHHLKYNSGARLNDSGWMLVEMRNLVNTVLEEAMWFLLHLHYENVLIEANVDYTFSQILNIGTRYPQTMTFSLENRKQKNIEVHPEKKLLEHYNIESMSGRILHQKYTIKGITPKDEYVKNGPFRAFWSDFNIT